MRVYIIGRLLMLIPTMILLTAAIFFLVSLVPGNLVDALMAQPGATELEMDRSALEKKFGLDAPLLVQYGLWMGVGLAASTLATVLSLLIEVVSGYVGGKLDLIVQRFVDAVQCFPSLILLMLVKFDYESDGASVIRHTHMIMIVYKSGKYNACICN